MLTVIYVVWSISEPGSWAVSCSLICPLYVGNLRILRTWNKCSERALERKIDSILSKLRGTKKLDLFETARVIPGVPIEESTRILAGFIAKGKFDHVGLSEVRADSVRRAHSVMFILRCLTGLPLIMCVGTPHRGCGDRSESLELHRGYAGRWGLFLCWKYWHLIVVSPGDL